MAWWKQPARHALAARGIGTGRLAYSQLETVKTGRPPSGGFGLGYTHTLNKLSHKYPDPSAEIDPGDYEELVQPLFDDLSAADLLCDHGDYKSAAERLQRSEDRFGSLSQTLNIMSDTDAREYLAATQAITRKVVAGSRAGSLPRTQPTTQTAEKPRVVDDNSDSR